LKKKKLEKLTAIIPTLNEEKNIQRAIDSVSFADEVLVIDSFSTDKTVEIVTSNSNVKLIQRVFDNFSNQKNFAIQQAKYNWIFLLDADEEVTEKLEKEIKTKLETPHNFKGFFIFRNFFFKDKKVNFSGWQRDKVIRLFKKNENFYLGKVHEKIQSKGEVGFLKGRINHYSYKNEKQYKAKLIKYAKLQAEELIDKDAYVTPFHIVFKPVIRFFIHYFIKLGFLDGKRGVIMSYLSAYGVYKRYEEFPSLKKKTTNNILVVEEKTIIGYDAKRIFHNTTGLGNYGRDLVRILSKRNENLLFYLYNPKSKIVESLKLTQNIFERLPEKVIWKRLSSLWRQGPILKQLKRDNITLFHGLTGELPRGINKTKIKTIVTVHDLIFVRYPALYSYIDSKIHFEKVKHSTRIADRIIAISEQTKNDIVDFLKVPENRIEVIYQGCHQIFKEKISLEKQNEVIKRYSLPKDFILNVGTINERKNILNLVKSIQNTSRNLVVVGSKTEYFKKIEDFLKTDKRLNKQIFFLQHVPLKDLAALYQAAKLFVYPSIFEGFGIPIVEALFSKTPVISSTGSCFSEAGGPDSIYVDPKDISLLSEKIAFVLNNPEVSERMIENGYNYAQKFNDDVIAKSLIDFYSELVD
jgi:glycosyltransferase involved in cell wall biosynthesis